MVGAAFPGYKEEMDYLRRQNDFAASRSAQDRRDLRQLQADLDYKYEYNVAN